MGSSRGSAHLDEGVSMRPPMTMPTILRSLRPTCRACHKRESPARAIAHAGGVSPDAKTRPAEANQWLATADKALQPTPLEAAATPVMMPERTCPVRTDPRGVSGHGRTIRAVLSILLKVAAMQVPDHEAWVEENGRMACQIEG